MGSQTLSVAQVADRYGVSAATVLVWIGTGQVRAVHVGRAAGARRPCWRVTPESLAAFELARESGPVPAERKTRRKTAGEVLKFY